jgi:hypothetical protein
MSDAVKVLDIETDVETEESDGTPANWITLVPQGQQLIPTQIVADFPVKVEQFFA